MKKRLTGFLLCAIILFSPVTPLRLSAAVSNDFLSVADGIIAWKKADNRSVNGCYLINEAYLELAGTTPGDWYPIGLGRLWISDKYDGYLAVIRDRV